MNKILWLILSLIGIYSVSAYLLDPESKDSTEKSSLEVGQIGEMTTDRAAHQATHLKNEQVLITGGCAGQGCARVLSSAELYDPVSKSFRLVAPMSTARTGHTAVALSDGRVLVIGGWTGLFSEGPEMQFGRHKIRDAVVKLPSGNVLVAGGARKPEFFDINTQNFIPVRGQLNGPQMFATATLLSNGDVLVLGGYDEQTRTSDTAWIVHKIEKK